MTVVKEVNAADVVVVAVRNAITDAINKPNEVTNPPVFSLAKTKACPSPCMLPAAITFVPRNSCRLVLVTD